jgi:uncharacterized protein (TIGR02271 family)
MSHTVIGIFEYTNQAQEAKSYLVANGFVDGDVDIKAGGQGQGTTGTAEQGDEDFGDRISNFFSNLFSDEDEKSSHIDAGRAGTIVTVHATTDIEAQEAVDVLNNYGAVDVNEYAEKARANASYNTTNAATSEGTASIPVIQEELQVGKRDVETGGVRLRSRIVERPVEESIRLREEHVNIERTPVNRQATDADFAGFKEGTIEVTEHAERPVVAKDARVVEEVSLDKEVSEREETISDTVRHTEVDTENLSGNDTSFNSGTDSEEKPYKF